jgi:hypothetical protein
MGTLSNRVGIMGPASQIHLLDFNNHRLKTMQPESYKALNVTSDKCALDSTFRNRGSNTEIKHMETILEVGGGVDMFDEVILDDERGEYLTISLA